MQLARDEPIAAAAAAAAVASGEAPAQSNVENLLDIDFDGAAPASLQGQASTSSGLDDLVSNGQTESGGQGPSNTMDDLMGIFGSQDPAPTNGGDDLMNGFGGLSMEDASKSQNTEAKRTNEDILGLF